MPDAESTELTKRKVFVSSFFIHKYVPRQCSLRRKAPKNEPCASWISRTERRLRRIVTTSPASSSATACPSALIRVAGGALMALMRMADDSGKIMERFESECGEIGVRQKTSAVGKTIGPPAASEYAVAAVTRDRFTVHAHVEGDEPRNRAPADHDVVKRSLADRPAVTSSRDLEQ